MSCGPIMNFAVTANKLKEAQHDKMHKSAFHSPVEKISAPFKALASELSTDHKKKKEDSVLDIVGEKLDISTEAVPTPLRNLSTPLKTLASELSTDHKKRKEDSVLHTVAEKLGISTEAIPTPVRKLSTPLKTLASELLPSDHNNNGNEKLQEGENDLLNAVAQKLDEAKDTVVEKAKEAKEFVAKEAKVVNEKLEQITGD